MIKPVIQDDAFLDEVKSRRGALPSLDIWWLGQSGFLVRSSDTYILLDPYLSDSLTQKYANTDKPHVRMTERIVDPARLDFIDIITSSHNHTDHLDAETLKPILQASPNAQLVIPEANRQFVSERLGIDKDRPIGVDDGVSIGLSGIGITGIAAAHNQIERDESGRCKFLGYALDLGQTTIYHSGDTVYYDGLVGKLKRFRKSIALLPINGDRPERRVAGNLNGPEAAALARAIDAQVVIPCHYEMFEFNTAGAEEFGQACDKLKQPYRILKCGERWSG